MGNNLLIAVRLRSRIARAPTGFPPPSSKYTRQPAIAPQPAHNALQGSSRRRKILHRTHYHALKPCVEPIHNKIPQHLDTFTGRFS